MTLKQRLFVSKYLEFRNATKEALEIYDTKNRNSASVIGCRLLRNVKVKKEIYNILEADMSFSSYIVNQLKNSIEKSSGIEQVRALQLAFRLHGFI